MAKKKKSGWQRRQLLKQGMKPNKVGRPPGSVRMHQLTLDVVDGVFRIPDFPNWPPEQRGSVAWLLSPQGDFARHRLIEKLKEEWPERYGNISYEMLSRYVAAVLKRGRIFASK
jgi:hypothetical protein